MQKEPDFFHKVVNAGFSSGAPNVHHPFVGRLVVFFSFIWGNVPEVKETNVKGKNLQNLTNDKICGSVSLR